MRITTPKLLRERLGDMTKEQRARYVAVLKRPTEFDPTLLGDLHPVAQEWYEALADSPQSVLLNRTDWAYAAFVAYTMHDQLINGFTQRGMSFVMQANRELLCTELSRRLAKVEIRRDDPNIVPAQSLLPTAQGKEVAELEPANTDVRADRLQAA
jgi:hypothetical protein